MRTGSPGHLWAWITACAELVWAHTNHAHKCPGLTWLLPWQDVLLENKQETSELSEP